MVVKTLEPSAERPKRGDASDARNVPPLKDRLSLVSEEELCELLGIRLKTLRNRQLLGGSSLPPWYRVGRRKFFRQADIEAWLKRRCTTRAAA